MDRITSHTRVGFHEEFLLVQFTYNVISMAVIDCAARANWGGSAFCKREV